MAFAATCLEQGSVSLRLTQDKQSERGPLIATGTMNWRSSRVCHRIKSYEAECSKSPKVAARCEGLDIKTDFSLYDVNLEDGTSRIIREKRVSAPERLKRCLQRADVVRQRGQRKNSKEDPALVYERWIRGPS